MWINHFLTALKQNLGLKIQRGQLTQHAEFSKIRMKKDEDHVKRVVARPKLWVNDLWKKERPLVNICDGTIASDKMVQNVLSTRKTVEDAMTEYFTQFTTTGADVADPKISKYNELIRSRRSTRSPISNKRKISISNSRRRVWVQCVSSVWHKKRLDLKHVLQWPVTSKPWAICSKVDQRRSSSKSLFRNNLQLIYPSPCMAAVPSDVSCCIFHAIRGVKMIPITNLKPPTFLGWAKRLYHYMKQLPGIVIHIFFDVCEEEENLNILSNWRETKLREKKIADLSQQLSRVGERKDFLTNSKNKCCLRLFLVDF